MKSLSIYLCLLKPNDEVIYSMLIMEGRACELDDIRGIMVNSENSRGYGCYRRVHYVDPLSTRLAKFKTLSQRANGRVYPVNQSIFVHIAFPSLFIPFSKPLFYSFSFQFYSHLLLNNNMAFRNRASPFDAIIFGEY